MKSQDDPLPKQRNWTAKQAKVLNRYVGGAEVSGSGSHDSMNHLFSSSCSHTRIVVKTKEKLNKKIIL